MGRPFALENSFREEASASTFGISESESSNRNMAIAAMWISCIAAPLFDLGFVEAVEKDRTAEGFIF